MFESSFVDAGKTRRPWMVFAGACFRGGVDWGGDFGAATFVAMLPERGLFKALMLASVPMAPPAPPLPMIVKRVPKAAVAARKLNPAALVSHVVVPKKVAMISEAPALQTDVTVNTEIVARFGLAMPGTPTG